jgi:hypothetical protein
MTRVVARHPPSNPVNQDEEDVWDTVGATAERSTSPPPATEDTLPEGAQEQTDAVESQPSVEEVQSPPPAAAVGQLEERVEESPVEAGAVGESGIVDIANTLGAPTVTIVQSNL